MNSYLIIIPHHEFIETQHTGYLIALDTLFYVDTPGHMTHDTCRVKFTTP